MSHVPLFESLCRRVLQTNAIFSSNSQRETMLALFPKCQTILVIISSHISQISAFLDI